MPAAGALRPFAFGTYDEASSQHNPATNVVCSGAVLLLGAASNGGYYIGITEYDAVAGEMVSVITEGEFFLPVDWAGDAGATPARVAASAKKDLAGRPAYWLKDLGLVTDKKPASGGQAHIQIGEFVYDSSELKPSGIFHGQIWAAVQIRKADVVANAVTVPTTASITHTGAYAVFAEVSSRIGLGVDFFITALNSDPNVQILSSDISSLAESSTYVGDTFSHTFASAGSKTVAITVGGTTVNFTVVVSTTAAPTIALA